MTIRAGPLSATGRNCWNERGFRNLWIPGKDVIYVAPELIVHYIEAHAYRPPDEFCKAVCRCPDMTSAKYSRALESAGWPRELLPDLKPLKNGGSSIRIVPVDDMPERVVDVGVPPLETGSSEDHDSSLPSVDVPPIEH